MVRSRAFFGVISFLVFPAYLSAQPRIFLSPPYERALDTNFVALSWRTLLAGDSRVRYGLTNSLEIGEFFDATMTTQHELTLTGLSPATIYLVQFSSSDASGTSTGPLYTVSTASPASSTGAVNVYFNKSVMASLAADEVALGNQRLDLQLIDRIDSARYSIDVCLYNISGSVGAQVASALVNAKNNRGVKVRVITEQDNRSHAPFGTLSSSGIPVITDTFGSDGSGLMHNKFVVFDYRDREDNSLASAADDWVWTGSWNATDSGTFDDFQDVIEVQDQAIAGAYTREFEEMWGSSADVPDPSGSRFGDRKTDNTPHVFKVAGRDLQLYFSPSDGTSAQIFLTLQKAQKSVAFSLLLITDNTLANTLLAKRQAGLKVRGVLDDDDASVGGDFDLLKQNGVDVFLDPNPGLLHHKYVIVDAEYPELSPWLAAGSHNWTASANTKNDENTLLVQDSRLANKFLQEFAARYYEAGGEDSILTSVRPVLAGVPASPLLEQNYPNPFNPSTTIVFELPRRTSASVAIYNILGEKVTTLVKGTLTEGRYVVRWNGSGIASGMYFYRLQADGFSQMKKMILLR